MRVLITGGAGFIGSNLADRLLADGHTVVVVDNLETGRETNVPAGATFAQTDIADYSRLRPLFETWRFDAVAHCAASYADRTNWTRDTRTNVLGTVNVVKLCEHYAVKRLLYFQTALCYGHDPLDGKPSTPLPVDHPIRPDNSYAITKTAAEQFIAHSDLDWVSLRLANVYGPRNLSGPIPTFYMRLANNESCVVTDSRRDFVFISDLLDVALQALNGTGSGVYHVSTGTDFAITDAFAAVIEAVVPLGLPHLPRFPRARLSSMASFIPRPPDDAPSILLDPSITEQTFGWKATTPFDEGIAKAVAWYKASGPITRTFTHLSLKG